MSTPERFRAATEWLASFSEQTAGVVAAYVGGSIVNQRVDEWSDVDATVVTLGGTRGEVFAALLDALERDWQVEHRWVLPTPTWHGGLQVFAHVTSPDGGEPLILDIVVDDAAPRWTSVDPVRHGPPLVVHDPQGLVRQEPEDPDEVVHEAAASALRIAERLPVARWIVLKAIHRGHWPEAYGYYMQLGITPLVQLLRTVHCPQRWDFGLRYLDSDLPEAEQELVLRLLPADTGTLAERAEECFRLQGELLDRLSRSAASG